MEKLSLEEFRKIKQEINDLREEVANTEPSSERLREIAVEHQEKLSKLTSYDLSDIDFEEYRGFDISEMNFEGTGANLDFSIVECASRWIGCLKGCNIRNFDFSYRYTEEDFDSEFIEANKDNFWGLDIPDPSVRRRYYTELLTFEDLKKYNLYDRADSSHFDYFIREIIDGLGMELLKYIDLDILNNYSVYELAPEFTFDNTQTLGESVKTIIDEANSNGVLVDEEKIKEAEKNFILSRIYNESEYEKVRTKPELIAFISDEFIDFSDEHLNLKTKYIASNLTIADIVNNYSIFKDKKFLSRVSPYIKEKFTQMNKDESDVEYLMENFHDLILKISQSKYDVISDILEVVDKNISKEENLEKIYVKMEDMLENHIKKTSDNYLDIIDDYCKVLPFSRYCEKIADDDNDRYCFNKILKYSSDEKIKSYNIPASVFKNINASYVFETFGIDTIMEFDQENNGIFSEDNFSQIKKFYDDYIHYAGNNLNKDTGLLNTRDLSDNDDYARPYTKEEFEQTMYRAIMYGPTDWNNKGKSNLNFGAFSLEFSNRYLENYLKLKIENTEQQEKIRNVFSKYQIKYILPFLIDKEYANMLKQIDNNYEICALETLNIEDLSEEQLEEIVLKRIRKDIVSTEIPITENEQDIIKESFPEFFLDENAPEILKQKFYINTYKKYKEFGFGGDVYGVDSILILDDFENEEFIPYLKGKSLEVSKKSDELGRIADKFSTDEIIHIISDGFSGLDENKFEDYKKVLAYYIGNISENIPEITEEDIEILNKFLSKYPLRYIEKFNYYYIDQMFYEVCSEHFNEEQMQPWFELKMIEAIEDGILGYSEKDAKFLKKRFPQFFLDEDAPKELKNKFYTTSDGNFEITDFTNLEFQKYLEGKDLTAADKTQEISRFLRFSSLSTLFELANIGVDEVKRTCISENGEEIPRPEEEIDEEIDKLQTRNLNILNFYASSDSNMNNLLIAYMNTPNRIAQEELRKKYKLPDDTDLFLQGIHLDELEQRKRKIEHDLFLCPGLTAFYDLTDLDSNKISEYYEIRRLSKFHLSSNYRVDLAEQILGKMYGFLGYGNCRSVFELPQLDEKTLDDLIVKNGELTKDLYEEKYKIVGNVDIASKFFDNLASITSDSKKKSKDFWNIAKSINQKIANGFDGNIEELITACCIENNVEITDEIIKDFSKKMEKYNTRYKKQIISEHIAYKVNSSIRFENAETRKKLKNFAIDAIEESLNLSEKIDLNVVREYLEKEFLSKNEDGTPAYSNHITDHLEDLIQVVEELSKSQDYGEVLNKSVIDILKEEQGKIGQGWIRKLLKVNDFPEKLTVDEYNVLEEQLYGDSEIEIETVMVIGPKDSSTQGLERAFSLLADSGFENVLTFEKAEIMFNGLSEPYSEEFRKFFMRNKDKFIGIPEYYTEFTRLHKYFDSIISDRYISNRYKKGEFSIEEAIKELKQSNFQNIEEGEFELSYAGRKGKNWDQEKFERAKQIFKQIKEREFQAIPPEEVQKGRFRGRILRIDDPLVLVVGDITDCCQVLDEYQPGESAMMHSAIEKNGSVFIVEELDENGTPIREVAQSWVWRNGDRVCFDNVEVPPVLEAELKKQNAFDEILDVYIEEAKKIIKTDNMALEKLLESGAITEDQYNSMMIGKITVGTKIDDLIHNLSKKRRSSLENADIVVPIENNKSYTGMRARSLYTDADIEQLVIAKNDLKQSEPHKDISVTDFGLKYTKIREVLRRDGNDINPDLIKLIKNMNKTENPEGSIWDSIEDYMDVLEIFTGFDGYQVDDKREYRMDLSISESGDWYILTQKDNDVITVHDSLITTNFDENNPKSAIDKKMAVYEYTKELLGIFGKTQGKVQIKLEREGKFGAIDSFIKKGIISVDENGMVTVADKEKLNDVITTIDKQYDGLRTERMLSDIGRNDER